MRREERAMPRALEHLIRECLSNIRREFLEAFHVMLLIAASVSIILSTILTCDWWVFRELFPEIIRR